MAKRKDKAWIAGEKAGRDAGRARSGIYVGGEEFLIADEAAANAGLETIGDLATVQYTQRWIEAFRFGYRRGVEGL